jgi:predicted transcriptional regulator
VLTSIQATRGILMKDEKRGRFVLTNVISTELDILKRHVHVLKILQENEPAGIIKLSELTKHPQHMVRYSLRILEQEGLIEPSPHGAITTDAIGKAIPQLKDKLKEMNKMINELIKSLD